MKRNRMAHRTGGGGGGRYSTKPGLCAAVETTYSYLRPYLQRMEQPVRKRRNQKFSVSESDFYKVTRRENIT